MLRITPEDISNTIKRYFDNFMEYRKDVFISGKVQKYIINHIWEFCSWIWKVKSGDKNYPMIYLKYTDGKQWLIMQLSRIPSHYQKMEGCTIDAAIIQQQLRGYLWITGIKSVGNKVANSMLNNMNWTFVPIEIIKDVWPLKEIRDAALDYIGNHVKELEQIYNNQYSNYVMDKWGLEGLIKEMNETYEKAEFFDTTNYSKEVEKDTPF